MYYAHYFYFNKFSCRNDLAIAKVYYLIVSDFAMRKVKQTIAVVSCVTVPRTECEAASAFKSSKTINL